MLFLGSKSVWFFGSSIVYWAQRNALARKGGQDLGLQSRGANIRWFGKRGMLWNELKDSVEKKIITTPTPGFLIIQLGSNDLGKTQNSELIQDINRDILRIKLLLPNTRIVWSEI